MKNLLIAFLTVASIHSAVANPTSSDCLLLTGAEVGASALKLNVEKGHGDINYWLRTFSLQRDNANAIAWLQENDLLDLDNQDSIICRRIIDNNGKSKINYRMPRMTQGHRVNRPFVRRPLLMLLPLPLQDFRFPELVLNSSGQP